MKSINALEIKRSYTIFILNFIFLTAFSILCIFLFFNASNREYELLDQKVKETEKLSSLRKEINVNFDLVLLRFKELSRYRTYNADELSKQSILLEDIQNANNKIKSLIDKKPVSSISFKLYEKMNNNVATMANLQDSLFTSRYSIESYRDQLDNCLKANRSAVTRIRSGRFGR
ncbi:hypothetical protein [Pedobacter nototheniae]|uniref:hypothetical protein n=1 Tax=Pedobacter nototheniae TaxID=2488994 RepID=UPI00292D7756|nr:hypothetical protein [Pedobacter nototheniae]